MRPLILIAAFTIFIPAMANAACSDDADALAQKYGITASLPTAKDSTGAMLEKSGGVIAPPATGDMAAATPSVPNPEPMATAPALPAQTATGTPIDKTVKSETNAATDSQAASLLQAAHAASLKGDETTCHQRLVDARTLLEKLPTQSQ